MALTLCCMFSTSLLVELVQQKLSATDNYKIILWFLEYICKYTRYKSESKIRWPQGMCEQQPYYRYIGKYA